MRKSVTVILILLPAFLLGQKQLLPTDTLTISGEIKQERIVTLENLKGYTAKNIEDVVVTNHLGEKKGVAKDMKGVLLKEILATMEFKTDNPKLLSEFYFTLIASDGYKVVYSWNELFNTATGNNTYLVTEKDKEAINKKDERLLLVSATDYKTGRRYIKGLKQIVVSRAK